MIKEWSLSEFWPLLVGFICFGLLPTHKEGFPVLVCFIVGLLAAYFQFHRQILEKFLSETVWGQKKVQQYVANQQKKVQLLSNFSLFFSVEEKQRTYGSPFSFSLLFFFLFSLHLCFLFFSSSLFFFFSLPL